MKEERLRRKIMKYETKLRFLNMCGGKKFGIPDSIYNDDDDTKVDADDDQEFSDAAESEEQLEYNAIVKLLETHNTKYGTNHKIFRITRWLSEIGFNC